MSIEVETTIVLAEQEDGWHIRIQFDDGAWFLSEQTFPSRDDAEKAFYRWRSEIGAQSVTAQ